MDIVVVQFLTGLASASSLFLVASGLSIIFGVSRIVNFAHGSFYMLGAYLAWTLVERLPYGPLGFWGGIIGAAAIVALLGLVMETVLLRRIYRAPELFQLLATFGVVLIVQDATLWLWGPQDLLGPRAPGLSGAVTILGQRFPQYDLLLIVIGPVVLALLWLLFTRTRWGTLVRAATQDREMVGALGVDQKLLFTTVFMLGSFLAGLGGALQLPRESVNLQMDLTIITDAFVVVVVGGMGSLGGAFLAALLIGVLHAFGIVVFPKITLVLIFLVMAVVLVLRPYGLMGRKPGPVAATVGIVTPLIGPTPKALVWLGLAVGVLLLAAPLVVGDYGLSILTEMAILALFAASLHFMMGPGGMASFGHAAYFGLGAYAAALVMRQLGLGMPVGLIAAPLAGAAFGLIFGWFCVRLSGVYLAMLTLAFAQICWSVAFQWVDLTGGDNGLLNIVPGGWAQSRQGFYWLALILSVGGILLLRWLIRTPFGHALRAARDNPLRAEAVGMAVGRLQWAGFAVAAGFAGFAGGLFAYFKGSVFPTFISIPRSVDALLMVLLGGVDTLAGPIVGAVVYTGLHEQLMSMTDYWRAILGLIIVLLVVAFPQGLAGQARDWWLARQQGGRA